MKYNGSRLIPQPFLSINKSYQMTGDGQVAGSVFNIGVDGKFLINKGSPSSSGTFYNVSGYPADEVMPSVDNWLGVIITKQEALRQLFSTQGATFLVEGYDGSTYLQCNPRVKSIEFPQGNITSWANYAAYRINLEADTIVLHGQTYGEDQNNLAGQYKIENASEDWSVEIDNPDLQLFRLTHQISAKGKTFYSSSGTLDQAAWQQASGWVLTRLGLDYTKLLAQGVLNNIGVSGYNYLRGEKLNEFTGEFSVTENWLCFNPSGDGIPATEEFNIDSRVDMAGVAQISIRGTIKGLEQRDTNTRTLIRRKYDNALSKYNTVEPFFLARASGYANLLLNAVPVSYSIGQNPIAGVITYSFDYDNRPDPAISGAKKTNIGVNYDNQTDVFGEIYVVNRSAGPILQDVGTQTPARKNLLIEAIMQATTKSFTGTTPPNTDALVLTYKPTATFVFKSQDRENWDNQSGRYSRSVQWTYNN